MQEYSLISKMSDLFVVGPLRKNNFFWNRKKDDY